MVYFKLRCGLYSSVDVFLLGPAQYHPSVKSFPQMALICSREDRFKVSMSVNPGPGTYQVSNLCEAFLPATFLFSALTDVIMNSVLQHENIGPVGIVGACVATNKLYVYYLIL